MLAKIAERNTFPPENWKVSTNKNYKIRPIDDHPGKVWLESSENNPLIFKYRLSNGTGLIRSVYSFAYVVQAALKRYAFCKETRPK